MNRKIFVAFCLLLGCEISPEQKRRGISDDMEQILVGGLNAWYPRAVDTVYGGFLSSFTYDFTATADQDKMIVTQARHTWTNAKAAIRYPGVDHYRRSAKHGYEFLRDVMWDKEYGGFYQLVTRGGTVKGDTNKTAYGNAFGIYALAAYYNLSRDTSVLNFAKEAFHWIEEHSHDPVEKGYFQHLARNGTPRKRLADTPSTSDLGYKDQNSSIHLLEALTELYQVWPDPLVRERLTEMLILIRDTITGPRGNLTLFLLSDWTPVSFADSSREVIEKHHNLDHVSFGHDVETSYLLIEASHVLGLKNDTLTITKAKKMMDHALTNGWDSAKGGFYDEAYYFRDTTAIKVTRNTKNWWAQAEGLNALLLMADLYPNDEMRYAEKLGRLWNYTKTNLIDYQHGDWYAGGIDDQPELKTGQKGHIWKAMYHQYRSLENCIDRLRK